MESYKVFNDITEDILNLRTDVFIKEQNVPVKLEVEKDEGKYLHCCIYMEDKLIAYARINNHFDVSIIGRVCVDKNYRHLGFGSKIMRFAEKQITTSRIELHAQCRVKDFYKKLGYQSVGEEFLEAGIKHITMIKEIL